LVAKNFFCCFSIERLPARSRPPGIAGAAGRHLPVFVKPRMINARPEPPKWAFPFLVINAAMLLYASIAAAKWSKRGRWRVT
jgi:hypothetical protein